MLKSIKKPNLKLKTLNLNKFKISRVKLNRLSTYSIITFLLINAVILGLSIYKGSVYFNLNFFKSNVIQLIVVFIISAVVFYRSHQILAKSNPDKFTWFMYLICILIFGFNLIGMNALIERLIHRGIFGNSNYIFIFFTLIPMLLIISNYDFPLIGSLKKFYTSFRDNVLKNLGVYLFMLFVIAFVGLQNGTYIYALSIIPFILNIYLIKTLLSNIRK